MCVRLLNGLLLSGFTEIVIKLVFVLKKRQSGNSFPVTWFNMIPFCLMDLLAEAVTMSVCTLRNNKSLVAVSFLLFV